MHDLGSLHTFRFHLAASNKNAGINAGFMGFILQLESKSRCKSAK